MAAPQRMGFMGFMGFIPPPHRTICIYYSRYNQELLGPFSDFHFCGTYLLKTLVAVFFPIPLSFKYFAISVCRLKPDLSASKIKSIASRSLNSCCASLFRFLISISTSLRDRLPCTSNTNVIGVGDSTIFFLSTCTLKVMPLGPWSGYK